MDLCESETMESSSITEGNGAGKLMPKRNRESSNAEDQLDSKRSKSSQDEGMGSSSILGAMANNAPACMPDVQIVTKDGDHVPAHRAVLAQMSPVFRAMLTNGVTVESVSVCIPLPSISTAAFLPILEYLYTGRTILSCCPLSLSTAPLVVDAARFLLLSSSFAEAVSSFFAESLHTLLVQNAITLFDAPLYLSQALDMSISHTHDVLSRLTSIISSIGVLDLKAIASLSAEALSFLLEKTRIGSLRLDESEYHRFRCVVLWCALQVMGSSELPELLCNYLAIQAEMQHPKHATKHASLLLELEQFMPELQAALEPWLPFLDCYRIHSDILADVIVPMGIIPHSYLIHVLAFQVHHSKDMIFLRWKEHDASDDMQLIIQLLFLDDARTVQCQILHCAGALARSSIKVRPPGSLSSCLSMPPRFVRAELPITRTMHVYEWDFVVEKASNFMAVGFCSSQALLGDTNAAWLGYQPFGWVLSHTGQLFNGSKVGKPYAASFGAGARVRVHLNMVHSTCSFTVNNKAYGIAWTNVPLEVYPAAALTVPGRIRLEAAGGERKRKLVECLSSSLPGA